MAIRRLGRPKKLASKQAKPRRTTTRELTPKQRAFLVQYLRDFNGTRAYLEAFPGSVYGTASVGSSALLKDPRIAAELKAAQAAYIKRYAPTTANTMKELAALAFSNAADLYDDDGNLIPIHLLPRHVTASIKKVKSKEITATDLVSGEEKVIGHLREVEIADKLSALRLVGIEKGMFTEKLEVQAGKGFADALREARERVAKRE